MYEIDSLRFHSVNQRGHNAWKNSHSTDVDKTLKNARVELKTSPDAKNKLREAAQAVGVDLSAFILSAAMERAESVLDNQRRRELSNQSWELMNQLIAEPAQPTLALKALMKRKNSDGRQA